MPDSPLILCLASYFKGTRFLDRVRSAGGRVILLTVTKLLGEPWPRDQIDDVFAVDDFADRKKLVYAVAYLLRTRKVARVVALDDFDVEVTAFLREHFRLPGQGESVARFFRDKLAMRHQARELGVRIPAFCGLVNHDDLRGFLSSTPGPWLVKPRSEASAAGIHVCDSADAVWRRVDHLADEQSFHLVEQMVPGDLFHVDSLTRAGRVIFTEVNAYWKPLLDVYTGGGVYATRTVPRGRPEVATLVGLNDAVLTGFGLDWGASHTEFMRAHADGEFYFIETSCRVGGAETAAMVEAATGVNLWAEWAVMEVAQAKGVPYTLPPPRTDTYGGVVISLANTPTPDTSSFTDPEIRVRLDLHHHIGFVLAGPDPGRIEWLLGDYIYRIRKQFHAEMPKPEVSR